MSNGDLDQAVSNQILEAGIGDLISSKPETGSGQAPADSGPAEALYVPPVALETVAAVPDMDTSSFRAVGEATFGTPQPIAEAVHGQDDRVKVENTHDYPWRIHASLRITAADGSGWIGTGWFISKTTLITAGHVVYIHSANQARNGWVRRIEVIPGRNAATMPFGSITASTFFSVKGWTDNRDSEYDYAAIVLPQGQEFADVGWIGYAAYSDAELQNGHLNISGYPGDKPDGTQWYDHRMTDSVSERNVNGDRYSVGIHAYGGAAVNSATRINPRRFQNLSAWEQGKLE